MEIIIGLSFGSFCIAIAFLVIALTKKKKLIRELTVWLNEQRNELDDFRHRKELLEDHTESYINSLGETGIRSLYESQGLIARVEEMLRDIEAELVSGNISSAAAFQEFYLDNDEAALAYAGNLVQYMDMQGWPIRLERHIQLIGGELATASERFHELGVERRRRRPTSMSLKEARIRLLKDVDNPPTETN